MYAKLSTYNAIERHGKALVMPLPQAAPDRHDIACSRCMSAGWLVGSFSVCSSARRWHRYRYRGRRGGIGAVQWQQSVWSRMGKRKCTAENPMMWLLLGGISAFGFGFWLWLC